MDKVFTYATPHNGIDLLGLNAPDLGKLDRLHVRNFNRTNMRRYLALPDGDGPVNSLDGAFPPERFFCFVGTNYRDYDAFFGMAKRGTGPMSDGLVMMNNAAVQGAPRAFAHRSHSGPYGVVNSEEGYQNLRRFLFGDVRVDATLVIDEITLPKEVEDEVGDEHERVRAAYNIEAGAKIRGLNVFLSERRTKQESAIRRTYEQLVHDNKEVYLFSGYLARRAKTPGSRDKALAFAIDLAVEVPVYEIDRKFWLDQHFEGSHLFQGTVTFHVRQTSDQTTVRYSLVSTSGTPVAQKALTAIPTNDGRMCFEVPIGFKDGATNKPKPGMRGRLRITTSPWQ